MNLTSRSGEVSARSLSGPSTQLLSYRGAVTGTDMRSSHVVATTQTGAISLTFSTQPILVRGHSQTGSVGVILPPDSEAYRLVAEAGGSKTITAMSDPAARRNINVRSEENDVSVLLSPTN